MQTFWSDCSREGWHLSVGSTSVMVCITILQTPCSNGRNSKRGVQQKKTIIIITITITISITIIIIIIIINAK